MSATFTVKDVPTAVALLNQAIDEHCTATSTLLKGLDGDNKPEIAIVVQSLLRLQRGVHDVLGQHFNLPSQEFSDKLAEFMDKQKKKVATTVDRQALQQDAARYEAALRVGRDRLADLGSKLVGRAQLKAIKKSIGDAKDSEKRQIKVKAAAGAGAAVFAIGLGAAVAADLATTGGLFPINTALVVVASGAGLAGGGVLASTAATTYMTRKRAIVDSYAREIKNHEQLYASMASSTKIFVTGGNAFDALIKAAAEAAQKSFEPFFRQGVPHTLAADPARAAKLAVTYHMGLMNYTAPAEDEIPDDECAALLNPDNKLPDGGYGSSISVLNRTGRTISAKLAAGVSKVKTSKHENECIARDEEWVVPVRLPAYTLCVKVCSSKRKRIASKGSDWVVYVHPATDSLEFADRRGLQPNLI